MNHVNRFRSFYEGRWIFSFLLIIILLLLSFHYQFFAIIFIILLTYTVWFFRDPKRVCQQNNSFVISPADGTITVIDEVEEKQFFQCKMKRISIFLSIFNVHINRSPIAGKIIFMEPRGGLYLDARTSESSLLNESLFWVFASCKDPEKKIAVKQITGSIARRIVAWAKLDMLLQQGERFGMIRFGSRTDIYLPLSSKILIKNGDSVKGGETIIANIN